METVLLSFDLNLDTKIFVANLLLSKIKLNMFRNLLNFFFFPHESFFVHILKV